MPRGYRGGLRRHRFGTASYGFARRVRDVTESSGNVKGTLCTTESTPYVFTMSPGSGDSAFSLPATELSFHDHRKDYDDPDTVILRGCGIHFEVVSSRRYVLRIMAIRRVSDEQQFKELSSGVFTFSNPTVGFAPIRLPTCSANNILGMHDKGTPLFEIDAGRDAIYSPLSRVLKPSVILDQYYHGKPGFGDFQLRPFDCWVDINRKVTYVEKTSRVANETRATSAGKVISNQSFYWVVLVHIPCFEGEKRVSVPTDLSSMDIREEVTEREAKRRTRSGSNTSTVLGETAKANLVTLEPPVLEIRRISSRIYWRSTSA